MTYIVFGGTLNLAQSIDQSKLGQIDLFFVCLIRKSSSVRSVLAGLHVTKCCSYKLSHPG